MGKPPVKKNRRTRRSLPQERGEMRRLQLIRATIELLNIQKIQNISYADIAKYAGIPLPSCYHFLWLSGHVPPAISLKTRERDAKIAVLLKDVFCQHFCLPKISDLETIFYLTHEIGDRIYSISQMLHGDITDAMVEESKRAKKGYLLNYLPLMLEPVIEETFPAEAISEKK